MKNLRCENYAGKFDDRESASSIVAIVIFECLQFTSIYSYQLINLINNKFGKKQKQKYLDQF